MKESLKLLGMKVLPARLYRNIYCFLKLIKNTILYGYYEPLDALYFQKESLVYIAISKAANSSIRNSLSLLLETDDWVVASKEQADDYSVHDLSRQRLRRKKNTQWNYVFSVVRNPFSRLVSCYKSKFKKDITMWIPFQYRWYLFNYFSLEDTFDDFVNKVVTIPDCFAETHIKSQYASIYYKWKCLADYIWKFENLTEDFECIRQKYTLEALPMFNATKKQNASYMDRYTPELLEKVYKRYKKDVDAFGYDDEYLVLKEYVDKKFTTAKS